MHHNHWSLHTLKPVLCNKKAQLESSPDCCNYRKHGHNSENLAQPKINLKEFLKKIRVEWKPETKTYMDSIIFFVKISSNSLFKPVFMVSGRKDKAGETIDISVSFNFFIFINYSKQRQMQRKKNYLVKLIYYEVDKIFKVKQDKLNRCYSKRSSKVLDSTLERSIYKRAVQCLTKKDAKFEG